MELSGNRASQAAFEEIKKKSEEKGLKINEGKTQLLSVSSASFDTAARLKVDTDNWAESSEELKMLGFGLSLGRSRRLTTK